MEMFFLSIMDQSFEEETVPLAPIHRHRTWPEPVKPKRPVWALLVTEVMVGLGFRSAKLSKPPTLLFSRVENFSPTFLDISGALSRGMTNPNLLLCRSNQHPRWPVLLAAFAAFAALPILRNRKRHRESVKVRRLGMREGRIFQHHYVHPSYSTSRNHGKHKNTRRYSRLELFIRWRIVDPHFRTTQCWGTNERMSWNTYCR